MESTKLSINYLRGLMNQISPWLEGQSFEPSADLIASGVIDSYSIIQLIAMFEEQLGIVFDYSDLNVPNFQSLQALLDMLVKNYGCQPGAEA